MSAQSASDLVMGRAPQSAPVQAEPTPPEAVPPKNLEALKKAEERCKGGDVVSCIRAGGSYALGDFGAPNPGKAYRLLTEACTLGHLKSCSAQALRLSEGDGVAQGSSDGCHALGKVYYSGRGGAGEDIDKAITFIGKGCDLGFRRSCAMLGILERKKREATP